MTRPELKQPARRVFGTLPNGQAVDAVTLINANGMQATVITYGASIQSVIVPDKLGEYRDVTIGHSNFEDYLRWPQYAGATVGRFANRVAEGRFSLDGHEYQLAVNNGANALHGGTAGFDKLNWRISEADSTSVTFELVSPDGDQGYPGTLNVAACYTLHDDDRLSVEYTATTCYNHREPDKSCLLEFGWRWRWHCDGSSFADFCRALFANRCGVNSDG